MRRNPLFLGICLALALAFAGLTGCAKKPAPADLVLLNGDVATMNPAMPTARAVVITGNKITAVCANDRQARRYVGPKTRVFDFLGKFVLPGLIDARVHFEAAGAMIAGANLLTVSDAAGLRKEIQRVVDLLDDGEWITDGPWGATEQGALGDAGGSAKDKRTPWRPNRSMIDDITPNHPCFLGRFDGKEWLANTAALAEAGLDKQRLPGLEIEADGRPTGIIFPATPAFDKVKKTVKPKSEMRLIDESRAALLALREAGITEIHDVATPEQTKRFIELEKNGELSCRIWLQPDLTRGAELIALGFTMGLHPATKEKSSRLRYGALKGPADGSTGDQGARPELGSDWPGTGAMLYQVHPKDLIYAAVTGKAFKGTPEGGWQPEQKITVEEAIRAATINNAHAAFEDGILGSLEAGKLADITVFDRNLLKIAPEDILNAKVTHTIVDGKIVYRRRIDPPKK
jgi:predicted amidohydrolase YtcJ